MNLHSCIDFAFTTIEHTPQLPQVKRFPFLVAKINIPPTIRVPPVLHSECSSSRCVLTGIYVSSPSAKGGNIQDAGCAGSKGRVIRCIVIVVVCEILGRSKAIQRGALRR